MKKIVQINSVIGYGSTGKIVDAIDSLSKILNFDSYRAYGRRLHKDIERNVIKIGCDLSVYAHGIYSFLFDGQCLGSNKTTLSLIEDLEKISPNLIHLHNIHGYYLNYPLLFSYLRKSEIPVVWTLHDCWSFTGHCAYYSRIGCDKWKTGCHECPQKKSYPASIFLDRSKRNYKLKKFYFTSLPNLTITTVSEWLAKQVKQSFLKDTPLRVIQNGVDTKLFSEKTTSQATKVKYGLKGKHLLVGLATSWSERKGLSYYNALAKILPEEYDIMMVGLTAKQMKLAHPRIHRIQRTDSQEALAEIYSAADIVLNLSHEETFGLTTVEGFACGTPSIVLNKTASPELITEATGFIVQEDTVEEIIKAIFAMIEKGRDFYNNACRERALTHYDQNSQYQKYIDLYHEILNASQ